MINIEGFSSNWLTLLKWWTREPLEDWPFQKITIFQFFSSFNPPTLLFILHPYFTCLFSSIFYFLFYKNVSPYFNHYSTSLFYLHILPHYCNPFVTLLFFLLFHNHTLSPIINTFIKVPYIILKFYPLGLRNNQFSL